MTKYLRCPACKRRSVTYKVKERQQSNYRCKNPHCRWYAFTESDGVTEIDKLVELQGANPHQMAMAL